MRSRMNGMESCVIIGGLVATQAVYAANSVLLSYLMSIGFRPLSLISFSAFFSFLFLFPFCLCFERSNWPLKLSRKLLMQLLLIAFGGITLFQSLFLKGIKMTSPVMATAMPNLSPGIIFLIAWTFRLERVNLSCFYSKVKIFGTLFCVIGAIAMSIFQSTTVQPIRELTSSTEINLFDKDKLIGSIFLMTAVLVLSITIILQATSMVEFPAPMSLCGITSLIGGIITALLEICQDQKFDYGWPIVHFENFIGYSFLGGTLTGMCLSFNAWAIKNRGPVAVSMFNPVSTICSLLFSVITLGEHIKFESIVSMFVVFGGLYVVLWAKGKEAYLNGNGDFRSEFDSAQKKPLLS